MNTNQRLTSREWWNRTKADPVCLLAWLFAQYRGEVTAADRILRLRDAHAQPGTGAFRTLTIIAEQERSHASWVAELLRERGAEPQVRGASEERYWGRTLPGIHDLETGCAVGAHAEAMRLERIEAIASDPEAPADIRAVFARILPQERFHERGFRALATPEALARTQSAHELGRQALGLVA